MPYAFVRAAGIEPRSRKTIDGQPVIEFEQVVKAFGSFTAVHESDLAIAEGEFYSLLGPSGCGKTTTLRMIAGFERPTRGRVLLDGTDVSATPPYRRNVNTVFQQYALFPHLDVFDNVAFGLRSARVAEAEVRRRVDDMLAVVRLEGLSRRKPAALSGGQQQRVALARALVNRPRALLLDEPLGALDLKLRETMQGELKRIQRELGSTFVYVTHDQGEALAMSDRIAVMHQGRTEQVGTPRDVYHRPTSAFVASFIGNANLLPATPVGRDGERIVVEVDGLGRFDALHPTPGAAATVPTGPLLFMVRPEAVEIGHDRPANGPAVAATISEVVFLGAARRCRAVSDGGTELIADLGPGAAALRPGDRRWVWWDPAAATVVPAASDAGDERATASPRTDLPPPPDLQNGARP